MKREVERVVLLTVADPEVGLGHLFRCDALVQAMLMHSDVEARLFIACSAGKEWLEKRAPESPYSLEKWNTDADITGKIIREADMVVVDAYTISYEVWEELRGHPRLAVFDDTGEKPPFEGFLINGSPGAHFVGYEHIPGRTLLLGTDYQVLRPSFWKRTERNVRENIKTVLIMAGGTDHVNSVETMVQAAKEALPADVEIKVIGSYNEDDNRVKSTGFLDAAQIKEEFDNADLLITAAGQTVAEAVSCALPAIMVQTADNQEMNVRGWEEKGTAIYSGKIYEPKIKYSIVNAIRNLKEKKIKLYNKLNLENGVRNITKEILFNTSKRENTFY